MSKKSNVIKHYSDFVQPKVETLFNVNGDIYPVEGYGQETVAAIKNGFPDTKIVHVGFQVDGKFVEPKMN